MMGPEDLPSINALLNGTSGLLLTVGYAAVRRRWLRLHAACMVAALGVSVIFLASYLYYHIVIRQGQPTRFTGEGEVRVVYFTILFSHTVLAAVVAPVGLSRGYGAGGGGWDGHVRFARWTLPLWLYVSVTGVVVYWMLYRLYPPV